MRLGIVVGLEAEARIARHLGCPVAIGVGGAAGAALAAERLLEAGADALLSFGLAGGLDPALAPGALVIPRAVRAEAIWPAAPILLARLGGANADLLFGAADVAATAAAKRELRAQSLAAAVDLESAPVARAAVRLGLGFAVLRAVCDPAGRGLPGVALAALDPAGGIAIGRVLAALISRPGELHALPRLARDAAAARRALLEKVRALGPLG